MSCILAGVPILLLCCARVSSNAAISTLVVVGLRIALLQLSSTMSVVASFKNFWRRPQKLAVVQVSLTPYGVLLCSPKTLCRLCVHRGDIHIVLSHKTPLQQQFYSEYLSVWYHSVGIYGILSLRAKPHKIHMLCSWVL